MRTKFGVRPAALIVLVASMVLAAFGSIVEQVTIEQMLKNSELVFEGTVIGINPQRSGPYSRIETQITFRVNDIVKGSFNEPAITLTFLGGTIGPVVQTVADMHMPGYGERGVYFVESLQRKQVHPLYGWEQGHFIVQTAGNGSQIVTSRTGAAVVALQTGSSRVSEFSNGVAVGVQLAGNSAGSQAMTVGRFKQELRQLAARLK